MIQHLGTHRLFVLSFKNDNYDPARDSFNKYIMTLAEIKYYNSRIDNKIFFDRAVKNKQHKKKLLKYDKYKTGTLLDF